MRSWMGERYTSNHLKGPISGSCACMSPPTGSPVTTVPAAFEPLPTDDNGGVNVYRTIHFSEDTLRFGITA
jgi:hypothetical protein